MIPPDPSRPDPVGLGGVAEMPASPRLEDVVAALRRLAVAALDAGHPLSAARIASTADVVEAEAGVLPARPRYRPV
jgi:hypothetical protein